MVHTLRNIVSRSRREQGMMMPSSTRTSLATTQGRILCIRMRRRIKKRCKLAFLSVWLTQRVVNTTGERDITTFLYMVTVVEKYESKKWSVVPFGTIEKNNKEMLWHIPCNPVDIIVYLMCLDNPPLTSWRPVGRTVNLKQRNTSQAFEWISCMSGWRDHDAGKLYVLIDAFP